MIEITLWFAVAAAGLLIAGLGSGLETGIYSLNPVRLHVLEHSGSKRAQLLARHLAAPSALIASMLILHNAGVKLATHAAAVLLHTRHLSHWQVVFFDALIMMPLLFIFSETVPKNLFAVYADRLIYPFARLVVFVVWVCRYSGLTLLLAGTSQLFMRLLGARGVTHSFHPRHRVQALVREGVGHGLLDDEQLALAERTMALGGQRIEPHMIPWKQVIFLRETDGADVLWKLANEMSYTRYPVVVADGKVTGVLNIIEPLMHDRQNCPPITQMMEPVRLLDVATPLRQALSILRMNAVPMAVVTVEGQPAGIVTLKDLIEPITGELAAW